MSDLISRDAVCRMIFNECHIKAMGGNNWIRIEEIIPEPYREGES